MAKCNSVGELGKAGLRGRPQVVADPKHLIWVMPAQGNTMQVCSLAAGSTLAVFLFSRVRFCQAAGKADLNPTGVTEMNDPLVIAGKEFGSRLMVGTGRHRSMEEMVSSIEAISSMLRGLAAPLATERLCFLRTNRRPVSFRRQPGQPAEAASLSRQLISCV